MSHGNFPDKRITTTYMMRPASTDIHVPYEKKWEVIREHWAKADPVSGVPVLLDTFSCYNGTMDQCEGFVRGAMFGANWPDA